LLSTSRGAPLCFCKGHKSHRRKQTTAAHYLRVILDTWLTWSADVNLMRKMAAQRLCVPAPSLTGEAVCQSGTVCCSTSSSSAYAYPICRSAVRSHNQKLQVLQSKCLRIATNAPWYGGNRQILEDLGDPFFADHIRALSFVSKLADAGSPLVRQLGRNL
jgi:hypothetical protein